MEYTDINNAKVLPFIEQWMLNSYWFNIIYYAFFKKLHIQANWPIRDCYAMYTVLHGDVFTRQTETNFHDENPTFCGRSICMFNIFFDDSHTMYYYTFYFGKKGRVLTLTKIEANFFCLLHIKKLHWTCKLMIQLSRSVPVHFSVKDI